MKLGVGIGLRSKHYGEFLNGSPRVDWVEAITENFLGLGGRPLAVLEKVRADRPVVLHGVSLGIASLEPPDASYLRAWKSLIDRIEPSLVSDHLCWGRAHGRYAHDLLPVPFTEEALQHVVERISRVQDFLGRRLVLENVSSYLEFRSSELTEWEFLAQVATRADCQLLLDVNNVFVSAHNHGFDADEYLAGIPVDRVAQFHLAGHSRRGELLIDTHEGAVSDDVLSLYARALTRFGTQVPTLIEWDEAVPALEVLQHEAERIRAIRGAAPKSPLPAGERVRVRGQTLAQTQSTLFTAITEPVEISDAARSLVRGHLEVYAEMYWLRLRDVLRDTFPITRTHVEDFDTQVARLLKTNPSTSPSIDAIGANFPALLSSPWNDVAALEWARAEAFVARNAPVVAFTDLQSIPASDWPALRLVAHPSLRILSLATDPRPALRDGGAPISEPTALVIWRTGFEVFHSAVSPRELEALRALQARALLPDVLAPFDDDAPSAFEMLHSWLDEGMVSSLERAD